MASSLTVNYVYINDNETPIDLINKIKPSYYVREVIIQISLKI